MKKVVLLICLSLLLVVSNVSAADYNADECFAGVERITYENPGPSSVDYFFTDIYPDVSIDVFSATNPEGESVVSIEEEMTRYSGLRQGDSFTYKGFVVEVTEVLPGPRDTVVTVDGEEMTLTNFDTVYENNFKLSYFFESDDVVSVDIFATRWP